MHIILASNSVNLQSLIVRKHINHGVTVCAYKKQLSSLILILVVSVLQINRAPPVAAPTKRHYTAGTDDDKQRGMNWTT
jgi:hypothetical protein